ncbi:TonB-dependent receptor [Companilactobacillus suantsaicola]|uniref:TonB-dependent receptor n=1 Tax=Companilactobacillus suantsaicola TaxID=2487723 RepID=A0A4Z0JM78_9LACO|nr:TonB-dependent receptor [Companilactobacillus suantsaicola]TGD22968.1 TonB-dependent receptor [Companilactobacillus suantsaicola]
MWSDVSQDNYIDTQTTEPQIISAWIFVGGGDDWDPHNAQGMTFTVQNDDYGTSAIGAGQQGLGAYGYDETYREKAGITGNTSNLKNLGNTDIAKSAIQNSVSIEFDATPNKLGANSPISLVSTDTGLGGDKSYGTLGGFDGAIGAYNVPIDYPDRYATKLGAGGAYGHISFTYPGNPETYLISSIDSNDLNADWGQRGYQMYHIRTNETTIINTGDEDNWHHVTITWQNSDDGKTANLKYSFNDKYRDGTYNNNLNGTTDKYSFIRSEAETTVDMSTFGNIKDHRLLWGFTGSNDNKSDVQAKLVDFESIPALVSISSNAYIVDNTLEKTISVDSSGAVSDDNHVNNGDNLTLHYNLNYLNGKEDWSQIESIIQLPDHFNVTPDENGNVAKISFANGAAPEYITAAEVSDSTLKHVIKQAMNDDNDVVNIEINGKAVNDTDSEIEVDAAGARFKNTIGITTTSTPEFIIDPGKQWKLTLSQPEEIELLYQPSNENIDLVLSTNLTYDSGHTFSNGDTIIYKISVAGKTYTTKATTDSTTNTANISIPLKDIIDSDDSLNFWDVFNPNKSQPVPVKVYAYDLDSVTSNTVTYNVNVTQKYLELAASDSLQFQDITSYDTKKVLKRKSGFNLDVISYDSTWQLSGKATGLKNEDNNSFKGAVCYVDPSDGDVETMYNEDAIIASQNVVQEGKKITSIDDKWNADNGVLLSQTDFNQSGVYEGQITWTLTDTVG